MPLKIEPATVDDLNAEFGTDSAGNDPETVKYILELEIGAGFRVTPEGDETERQVKRRINACAREAFRELDWRAKEGSKTLTARVKSIDTKAMEAAKVKAEEEAKTKAEAEAKAKAEEKPVETPTETTPLAPNGAQASQEKQEPVKAGKAA